MASTFFIRWAMMALALLWSTAVWGVQITLDNAPPLHLDQMQVLHQERFDQGTDPSKVFWGVLDIHQKQNDPWTGMLAKGAYTLTHTGKTGAVRYYFRENLDEAGAISLSERPVSVEVAGTFTGEIAGAGLLYAFDAKNKHYFGFVVGQGRSYAVYQRDQEGMRRVVGGDSPAVQPDKANRLAIVPSNKALDFYINGTHVANIASSTAPRGAAGILAISSGLFIFDNFTVYQTPPSPAPAQPPAPAPAQPAEPSPVEQEQKQNQEQPTGQPEAKQDRGGNAPYNDPYKQPYEKKREKNALFD